jgi:hypothetical protein
MNAVEAALAEPRCGEQRQPRDPIGGPGGYLALGEGAGRAASLIRARSRDRDRSRAAIPPESGRPRAALRYGLSGEGAYLVASR